MICILIDSFIFKQCIGYMGILPQAHRLSDFDSGKAILLEDTTLLVTNNYIAGQVSNFKIKTRTRSKIVGNKKWGGINRLRDL